MGRRPRTDFPGGWHHVMNRGAGRFSIFELRRDGELFENLLGDAVERFGIEVHAYCLMPNHYHLLVHCPEGGLSAAMQRIGAEFTRAINAARHSDGPLFRGRFRSIVLDTPEYVATVGNYIHQNPVDLVPPVAIDRYRWSSLRVYAGHDPAPPWLSTNVLSFSPTRCLARRSGA